MEASSHGLDQFRLEGLQFQAAGFTNLTQDHLDYHKTLQAYQKAKMRLFERYLMDEGMAVLNADTPEYNAFEAACGFRKVLSYGKSGREFHQKYIEPTTTGQKVAVSFFDETMHFTVPLVGRFQVMNVLCALGLVVAGYPETEQLNVIKELMVCMGSVRSVPGRMEKIAVYKGAGIYVDFAHTPNALQGALEALKHHVSGQLWVVFGCGGNRDSAKRQVMGTIATQYADHIIITDDNPRLERSDLIRQAILTGCPEAREIGDRRIAIQEAIYALQPGDVLLVAGKGHEEGQVIGSQVLPFNDKVVIREILEQKNDSTLE
jgi:UDP-N-acetylmuramoyl-L-alanyl-D-glutamate--2,6-diaminopimelate ligase